MLKRHYKELSIPKVYIYLIAVSVSVVLLVQGGLARKEGFGIYLGDMILVFATYVLWAYLTPYINKYSQPDNFKKNRFFNYGIFSIIGLLMLALINLLLSNLLFYAFVASTTSQSFLQSILSFSPYALPSYLSRLIDLSVIVVFIRIVSTYQSVQHQKLQISELESNLHQSKLQALQAQLNPHFLFNTLHTLNTLIGYDDAKARSMVIKVTHLLRKILSSSEDPLIPLEEELEFFRNYLDIEKERFSDRLSVNFSIDPASLEVKVPTLILQPIIENAFKHGISQVEGDASLTLDIKVQGNNLLIKLTNSVPSDEVTLNIQSTKLGLSNLRSRLESMYPEKHDIAIIRTEDSYQISITLKDVVV